MHKNKSASINHWFNLHYKQLRWFILAIIALPFLAISYFVHPMGDDYWITSLVREHGYVEAQIMLYKSITARYTLLAIAGASPLSFGNFWLYKIIPLIYVFLFWGILSYFFQSYLCKVAKNADIFFLSAVITVTYLAVMPGLGEGVFWFSSLVSYQFGILFFLLWLACWNWYYRYKSGSLFYAVATCTLLVMLSGLNELFAMLATGLIFIILSIKIYSGKNSRLEYIMLILIAVAWWFLLSAQSFSDRYVAVPKKNEIVIVSAVGYAIAQVGYHVLKCLLNPFLWIGFLLGAGAFERLLPYIQVDQRMLKKRALLLFFTCGISMLLVSFMTYYFIDIRLVPLRVTNLIIFILFSALLLAGLLASEKLRQHRYNKLQQIVYQFRFLIITSFFLIGFFTKNNVSAAYSALVSGELNRYDQQMKDRYQLLKNCQTDTCKLPLLKDIPIIIRYSIVDNDPHLAEYFRKKIVYIE